MSRRAATTKRLNKISDNIKITAVSNIKQHTKASVLIRNTRAAPVSAFSTKTSATERRVTGSQAPRGW